MLRFDRYLVANGRVCDLATGARVRFACDDRAAPALFRRRRGSSLIDWASRGGKCIHVWERWRAVPLGAAAADLVRHVEEALDVAAYGTPRLFDLPAISHPEYETVRRLVARSARQTGWIPVSIGLLAALSDRVWSHDLAHRSLLIFVGRNVAPQVWIDGLVRRGAPGGRPHLIVRHGTDGGAPRVGRSRPFVVRESAAAYGSIDASVSVGRATRSDELRARWWLITNELTRSPPARLDSCRLQLARILADRGQRFEARALVSICERHPVGDVGEGKVRLDRLDRNEAASALERWLGQPEGQGGRAMVDDFVGVLQLCQDTDDEHLALSRVGAFLRERLQAATVAFIVTDGPGLRVLARAGTDPPCMDAARRSIESGCPVPANVDRGPAESASPVRHAAEVIGALWCRWSAGTPIAGGDARTLLGVAAAASAPSLRAVVERYRPLAVPADGVPELVGESPAIRAVRAAILRAAASPFPVLIEGESGSGKELVARAIHACGARRDRRFCAINCAALVDDLVEAELFGHARGAFTGAAADRAGLFEEAGGGTLFLDEVAELGSRVQAKLLRTLQEGEVRRIGEGTVRKVDVRIVAATNRPLAGEVSAGRFRRDLWYRLDVVRIAMPPLRERLEDLPLLVRHLWATLSDRTASRASLAPSAIAALGSYDWPGNVRELQNVLASVLVAAPRRGVLGPSVWPAHVARVAALGPAGTLEVARRQFEERFVRAAMARAGGRTSAAARELGLSRQGLAKLLTRLGIESPQAGPPTSGM